MAEIATFFDSKNGDRKYNSNHFADYFRPLFTTGVFNGNLQVSAGSGMSIVIGEGYAWIDGRGYHNTAPLILDIETASGNLNRYDSVKIKLDLGERTIKAYIDKGVLSSSPVKKANIRTESIYEITIAEVYIAAGTTKISQANISDTRMDKSKCGIVTGAVEQIDFTNAMRQFESYFEAKKSELLNDFSKWFEDVQGILSGDAATNIAKKITDLYNKVSFNGIPTSTQEPPEKSLNKKYIKQLAAGHGILMRSNGSKFEELLLKNTPEDVYLTIPPHTPYGEYKDITFQQVLDAGVGGKSLISLLLSTAKEVTGNVVTSTTENGVYTWYDKPGQPTLGGYVFVYRYGANRIMRTAYGVDGNVYRCTSMLDAGKWGEWSRL